ncbi:helicase associated domain-containing protein [uncultured Cellulomonas sp.]|uniref:helicase associated domain-containing protein n=1 Tax=uncultured Cellulomonas sp. TaxID=189682 RepID=UPI00262A2C63|nr:helicase associated domain-containing protein [uncultured Cellulomonas sp.]
MSIDAFTADQGTPADVVEPAPAGKRDAWAQLLAELDWWVEQHGSAYVPQQATSRLVDGKPYPLGLRLTTRRHEHRTGKLSADRARELEGRPGWSWSGFAPRSEQTWTTQLQTVRAYADEHGTLDGLETAHPVAARWLRQQRATSAELSTAQRRELAAIPGALEQRKTRLEEFISAMQAWIAQDPSRDASQVRLSTVAQIDDVQVPIGKRAEYVRGRYAAGRLPSETVDAIAALPGWDWTPAKTRAAARAKAAAARAAAAQEAESPGPRVHPNIRAEAAVARAVPGQGQDGAPVAAAQ